MSTIQAVFRNGVFEPKEPVNLPDGCEVTVEVPTTEETPLEREIRRLTSRTPEEIMRAREEILKASRPARPLPEGKTHAEVVQALWPGDETDEQVREALEKLS
jgi:predicted DNA-binding antitoxin AbrB/MazE fold protein